jgi:hypothetical protein
MKTSMLVCLSVLLAARSGAEAAQEKKVSPPTDRAVAALQTIQKALNDLPPGAEVEQIKKAVVRLRERIVKDLRGRLALTHGDLEMAQERAQWSQRMARKGYMTRAQAEDARDRATSLRVLLDRLQQDLRTLGVDGRKGP